MSRVPPIYRHFFLRHFLHFFRPSLPSILPSLSFTFPFVATTLLPSFHSFLLYTARMSFPSSRPSPLVFSCPKKREPPKKAKVTSSMRKISQNFKQPTPQTQPHPLSRFHYSNTATWKVSQGCCGRTERELSRR